MYALQLICLVVFLLIVTLLLFQDNAQATTAPTASPTHSYKPTIKPTVSPTAIPSYAYKPTVTPTEAPTPIPTANPTFGKYKLTHPRKYKNNNIMQLS